MTQQELSVASGLSASYSGQLEQGSAPDPRLSTVKALCVALRVKLEALAGGLDEEPKRPECRLRGRRKK